LYEHRIALWIKFCQQFVDWQSLIVQGGTKEVWRSQLHSDGSAIEGWFVLGLGTQAGQQMTYHLPMNYWDDCFFAETLDKAPEFDGHTSADVLERLRTL